MKNIKKKLWGEIVELFQSKNLVLLSEPEEYKNKLSKLSCMDEDGYLYSLALDSVRDKAEDYKEIINKILG